MSVRASSSPPFAGMIGRDRALADVSDRFAQGAQLVTLLGPPGMGKTRLARAIERMWERDGLGPAWVDLPGGASPDEVCGRVADALGLRLSWLEPTDPVTDVGWALEGRGETRLILDEAERCLESVGRVLPPWLAAAAGARVLVTSQQRLGLAGEVVVEVGPLTAEDSARLLIHRSGAQDGAALRELVEKLEGIPLAIELIAARLSLLSAEEILARLVDGLAVMDPKRPGRATLRETIELSWDRLNATERRALSHCAIFTDSFRIDAAEAVIAHPDALQGLQGLRDKSLLARVGTRCRLYAPVRAVAADHLGAVEPARERFVLHYAAFAERALARLEGPDADAALRCLIDETEHLRAAWTHAPERHRPALARGLAEVALTRGPVSAALDVIEGLPGMEVVEGRALEILGQTDEAIRRYRRAQPEPSALLAHAELASGRLAAAAESVARAVNSTSPRTLARAAALRMRGLIHHARGELDVAFEDYRSARVMATELGSTRRAARLRVDIGAVRLQQGRLDEAREYYRDAIEGLDERTDPITLGLAEGNLAILEQELGDLEEAAALHARAFARVRRVGHRLYAAHLGGYAGAVEHERGDLRAALRRYGEALDGLRRVGDVRLIAVIGALRGAAEAGCDRIEAADEAFREVNEALKSVDDSGVERAAQVHLHHLALARARAGEIPQDGVRLSARAECLELERDAALSRSDDLRLALRLLRAALGHGSLRLDRGARRISLPDGSVVDLSRRAVLWRLVEAMAAARAEEPPRPMDAEALLLAGWPGETPTGESGMNRVKVALSTLRKLGLREVLCRRDGGYLFDPDVPLG